VKPTKNEANRAPPTAMKMLSDQASGFNNVDRLEKKKNREKRRRSEVNERFDEVSGVVGMYVL
jgi:hypothetical protein